MALYKPNDIVKILDNTSEFFERQGIIEKLYAKSKDKFVYKVNIIGTIYSRTYHECYLKRVKTMPDKIFKPIITEIIIPIGAHRTIFSEQRIIIKINDEAAGPYLTLKGWDDSMSDQPEKFDVILNTHQEIDELCEILHQTLRKAEETGVESA